MITTLNPQHTWCFEWSNFWERHEVLFRVLHHKRPHLLYPRSLTAEDRAALAARPYYGATPSGRLGDFKEEVNLTFDDFEQLWALTARALRDLDPLLRPEAAVDEAARYLTWWTCHHLNDAEARGCVLEEVTRYPSMEDEDTRVKVEVDFDLLWRQNPCSRGIMTLAHLLERFLPGRYLTARWWDNPRGKETLTFSSLPAMVTAVAEALGLRCVEYYLFGSGDPKHVFHVAPARAGRSAHVFAVATEDPNARPKWVGAYETAGRAYEEIRYLVASGAV